VIWVDDVRFLLGDKLERKEFVIDKSGSRMIELRGESFMCTEPSIFGLVNQDYVQRELEWYVSQSLNVNTIPGGPPAIWKQVATASGWVNSNYGWCVWSVDNGEQYSRVRDELRANPYSRRAVMIYNRPSMHLDYSRDGMSDFMCTNAVQYMVREGALSAYVQMRSNDAVFGYKNDYAWQKYVLGMLAADLGISAGQVYWNAGSLHVYERHFYLVDYFNQDGSEFAISKDEYSRAYPESEWAR